MTIEQFISHCSNIRKHGGYYQVSCPCHKDNTPSLSVKENTDADGRKWIGLTCFSQHCSKEDICAALGLKTSDLLISSPFDTPGATTSTRKAITLAELAQDKSLPLSFLSSLGLYEGRDQNGPGVFIPYAGGRTRKRYALKAKDGSCWTGQGTIVPYGQDRLPQTPTDAPLFLVEGESDCWTAWYHGVPALGLPSATFAGLLHAEHLANVRTAYVVREPDAGGGTFAAGIRQRVQTLSWGGELREVSLHPHKDLNALHKAVQGDSEAFRAALDAAVRATRPQEDSPKEETNRASRARQAVTAAELSRMTFAPPVSIVDGMLVEGLALLVGPPKLGKSWLALSLSVAVASGGRAFGQIRVQQGEALYLALEDNLRRLQDRLGQVDPQWGASRLHLATEWAPLDAGGMQDLDSWLSDHPDTRLVVIDTLARVKPKGKGRNVYDEDTAALAPLQTLALRHHVALLAVHHTRKADAEDVLQTVSGSTGLTGVADSILILQRGRGQANAELTVTGRDIEEQSLALSFEGGIWNLLGAADEQRLSEGRRQVLDALQAAGKPLAPAQIAKVLSKNGSTVRKLLMNMLKDGQVSQDGSGGYFMGMTAPDEESPLPFSFQEDAYLGSTGNDGSSGNSGNTRNTGNTALAVTGIPQGEDGGNALDAKYHAGSEARVTGVTGVTLFGGEPEGAASSFTEDPPADPRDGPALIVPEDEADENACPHCRTVMTNWRMNDNQELERYCASPACAKRRREAREPARVA